MLVDDAAYLIKRLIDATDEADASDANNNTNCSIPICSIIDEMRDFLSSSSGWECGKRCGFSGDYDACSVHEEACQFHSSEAIQNANDPEECEPEQLVREMLEGLETEAGEIDLSAPSYTIGDAGCTALCNSLAAPAPTLCVSICLLDLEANGLSSVGGSALAAALQAGAAPSLINLNVGCNTIGGHGASKLASALRYGCCPLLQSLDLHGNAIGDDGCVALGAALATGAAPKLDLLDLSANRIEDRGCKALAALFGALPCCPLLTSLNLRENGIESVQTLFVGATIDSRTATLPDLTLLDLSWNSIANFEPVSRALACTACPALSELDLKGNSLSDSGCERLCAKLKASGATPLLILQYKGEGVEYEAFPVEKGQEDGCHGVVGGERRLRRCLRLIADGDATNSHVCRLTLWESISSSRAISECEKKHESGAEFGSADEPCGSTETPLPFELLRRDGFVVRAPLVCQQDMACLAANMERLESAGWPPVFCFMNDMVWDFVAEQVWPVVSTLLGVDCVLDSGSAFAWSLKATGKSTFPRDGEFRSWQNAVSSINTTVPKEKEEEGHRGFGSSFGLPHRDYSAANSMYREDEEGEEGYPKALSDHPAILNVWIPLNDATLDNGCMYVVPREFDTDFARMDGHHAHMNPATEVQRGLSSKIQFPLHGVRALPAPAGSLIAWYGNTIHWGSTCSRFAKAPRKSIALTFRRGDIKVGGEVDELDETPSIHRPSPPITISQARDMSPALRLALISRSLLLYNQWHALADDAVPPLIYETTTIPEDRKTRA